MSFRQRDSLRLLATTALALSIALAAISHLRGVLLGRIGPGHTFFVRSEYGKFVLDAHRTDFCIPQGWRVASWPHAQAALRPTIGGWWRYGGFSYTRGGTTGGITVHQVAFPYWSLALTSLMAWLFIQRMREHAAKVKVLSPNPARHVGCEPAPAPCHEGEEREDSCENS